MADDIRDIGVRTVVENLGGFLSSMDRYNRAIGRAEESTRRFGERATRAGASLAAMAAPIIGIAALSLRTFGSFEQSMARVEAVTGATADQMVELTAIAQEMGRTTVFTARQAAEALAFMAQAGLSVQEQIGALPQVLQLASAAQIDLGTSADIVTNVMAGFGLEVAELTRANDVLVTAFTSANTDLVQLAQAFKFAGPVAKAAGITFEETAASLALMGTAGIQASMAGTGLRGAITRLLNPSSEAASVIATLGLQVTDTAGNMVPLTQIIEQLEASGLTAADAMTIFGQRAGPAMLALIGQGSDAIRTLVKDMDDTGVTARIAAVQLDTLQGSLALLKSAAEGAQISIGEALAPAIVAVAEALRPVLEGLAIWIAQNPELTVTIVALAAIVLVLGVGLAAIGFILPGIIAGLAAMAGVVAFLTGAVTALVVALGPIGLIILAISAAILAGIIIWRNWEKVLTGVKFVLNAIISLVNAILEGLALIPRAFGLSFAVPNIPMLAGGGAVRRGGAAIVGERGPEMVNLPAGAVVSPISRSTSYNVTANYSPSQAPQSIRLDLEALAMASGG